ncbi:unnamed protein product, partial [Clonostachys rosea]
KSIARISRYPKLRYQPKVNGNRMFNLFKFLSIAPDPSLQEPAGESKLDSLYHRPSRFDLGTDGNMPSRGALPACCERGKIPSDAYSPDTRHLVCFASNDAAAAVSRSRSPSSSSDDNHDRAIDSLHGARESTSPPTPECDGSPQTMNTFQFLRKHPRFSASTFIDLVECNEPARNRLRIRVRKFPRSAMIENEDREEKTVILPRSGGFCHLACPFYMTNAAKYKSSLLDASLQSVQDVIKHVVQHHKAPPYCSICTRQFQSTGVRDQHILARTCTVPNSGKVDSINEQQRFRRPKRDAVRVGERRHWSRIWETLFASTPSPKQSYLCQVKDGAMTMMNSYWANAGMIMSNEQLNDNCRLGDSYNEGTRTKMQDIFSGVQYRQPILKM